MAFLPYEREVADAGPRSVASTTPTRTPPQRILSLFADPTRSPDLAVVHTPRHWFPDEGGHVGRARLARRHPVPRAAGPVRGGGAPARVRRRPRPARRRGPDPRAHGRRRRGGAARRRRAHALDGAGRSRRTSQDAARRAAPGGRASSGTAPTAATCCTWPRPASCRACARLIERGPGPARRRGRGVPEHHADQPHVDPHRRRAGAARRAGQRLLRPCDRGAGRAERRRDLAPQRRVAAPGGPHGLRDGERRMCRAAIRRARPASTRRSTVAPTTRTMAPGPRQRSGHGRPTGLDELLPDPARLAVPARARAPRGRVLPLGRAGRRHGPAADAAAVGERRRRRPR